MSASQQKRNREPEDHIKWLEKELAIARLGCAMLEKHVNGQFAELERLHRSRRRLALRALEWRRRARESERANKTLYSAVADSDRQLRTLNFDRDRTASLLRHVIKDLERFLNAQMEEHL